MSLDSVFHFLSSTRKTGILHVDTGGERLLFEFLGGEILCTHSSLMQHEERLGSILVALGYVEARELAVLLGSHDGQRPLGEVLTRAQAVSHAQLLDALAHQAWLRFERASHALQASFQFFEREPVMMRDLPCVSVTKLMLDHARTQQASESLAGEGWRWPTIPA